MIFFFFQAEDGIRDRTVTGVQTCALPIFGDDRNNNIQNLNKWFKYLINNTDWSICVPYFIYVTNLEETPKKDRKSTRLNSSHRTISYAVFCLKKKKKKKKIIT